MQKIFLSKGQRRRHYRKLRIKLYLVSGLLIAAVVGSVYGLLNIPFLHIQNFEVSGSADFEEIRGELLKGNLAQFLGFKNFLAWPSKVAGFAVEKDLLTGTLRIIAGIADRFAIWCYQQGSGNQCYWINRTGQLLEKAPDTEGAAIPKIIDVGGKISRIGAWALAVEFFDNAEKIISGLDHLSLGIREYSYDEKLQELVARGVRGERLIFSVRFAPSEKLFSYIREMNLSGKLRSAEYLDFTVENRIYIK
ncbi:MAG: hypothetical protein G01um101419_30 [Parcubacteria group bacterium Gr01-1014_19]|nr:MAG: hypothetical protein G01um101419_30 [Parcubacteria group bacterium Gr01-1014_19]